MRKLKVGDKVRLIEDLVGGGGLRGDEFMVTDLTSGGSVCFVDKDDDERFRPEIEFELVESVSCELSELRAWKAAAIAKHPDLKEETDEEAANRLDGEYMGEDGFKTRLEMLRAAFAWARANPRPQP